MFDPTFLPAYLENRDLSMRKFADRCGIARARLQKLAAGKTPTADESAAISREVGKIEAANADKVDLMALR